jgi:flagellar biosynthetic protein FliR
VKIALAFLVALAAQAALPAMPVVPLDSPAALAAVMQQVLIGATLGFAARIVFAALEFAGEVIGLQMGLNFAMFFDPLAGGQATAVSRFFATMGAWLFVVINGHLMLTMAVVHSFQTFPVSPEPLAFLVTLAPQAWGAEVFRIGVWISMPMVAMILFANLTLGFISRVAPQINVFAVGFPITLGLGLVGIAATLPLMEAPFVAALEKMLALF